MKILPPERASNSAAAMLTSFGPHHFCRCSGRVKTSKTHSRGASNTRSITTSLVPMSFATLSLASTSLLLPVQFPEVLVQPIESLLPDHAIPSDPIVDVLERACRERRRPPLRLLAARNQPGTLEHLQVLTDRGQAHFERFGELADRCAALRETREDRAARWVGEGPKGRVRRSTATGCPSLVFYYLV